MGFKPRDAPGADVAAAANGRSIAELRRMQLQANAESGHDEHDAEGTQQTVGRTVAREEPHVHREQGEEQEVRAEPEPRPQIMGGLRAVNAANVQRFLAGGIRRVATAGRPGHSSTG